MEILNLQLYTPKMRIKNESPNWKEYNKSLGLALSKGAVFYRDTEGRDFYKVRDNWPKNSKYKMAFMPNKRIYCYSQDIQSIVIHESCSIVEVDLLPANFLDHHDWLWIDGELVEDFEKVQTNKRTAILAGLDARISVLQNRVDDGDAEERHVEELASKRKLRVAMRKLDVKVKIETWPEE